MTAPLEENGDDAQAIHKFDSIQAHMASEQFQDWARMTATVEPPLPYINPAWLTIDPAVQGPLQLKPSLQPTTPPL